MLIADILLPFSLPGLYSYRIPEEFEDSVSEGIRVAVHFGSKRIYTGLIKGIREVEKVDFNIKDIISLLDDKPIVNADQFRFWEWLSSYYLCTEGEVMNAALPSAFKLASETKLIFNPDFSAKPIELNDREYLVYEALQLQHVLTISELQKITSQSKIIPLVKNLIYKGMITVEEELKYRYRPKYIKHIKLSPEYAYSEIALSNLMDKLQTKAYRKAELLLKYIQLSNYFSDKRLEVEKSALLKNDKTAASIINSMINTHIFEVYDKQVSRIDEFEETKDPKSIILSDKQNLAFEQIKNIFCQNKVALLKGVTGSGKTEIYIRLINDALSEGGQALLLLPEIALTAQIVNRFKSYFGKKVIVYHSKFNDNERIEIWNKIINSSSTDSGEPLIIIGARSAIFLPFENLKLIIVDEEHDYSYKQVDPSPRYNARDAAVYLSSSNRINLLLGSATPSIESYYNAVTDKYGLVELSERYGGVMLPEINIADIGDDRKKKRMKSHFSALLFENIENAVSQKKQVILFQNRRGFASYLECNKCGNIPHCKNCDVTLTYHKSGNMLKCHYCGYSVPVPLQCNECGSEELDFHGFGTEKIEDEIPLLFPDVRVKRMDLDTVSGKYAHQAIIDEFDSGEIDVLVGTQMITKGLDFKNVSLVGILNADNLINFPDFRSFERSFQLITQVSGRAGRNSERGKVIIQTNMPYHSVIRYAMENDYKLMYESQIEERRLFVYPPFCRLIKISIKGRSKDLTDLKSSELSVILKKSSSALILGPEEPLVSKINNLYIKDIIVKLSKNESLQLEKKNINTIINRFCFSKENRSLKISIDVDPV